MNQWVGLFCCLSSGFNFREVSSACGQGPEINPAGQIEGMAM